eukprot:365630-Chlamydomonas_euryale.AAC.8
MKTDPRTPHSQEHNDNAWRPTSLQPMHPPMSAAATAASPVVGAKAVTVAHRHKRDPAFCKHAVQRGLGVAIQRTRGLVKQRQTWRRQQQARPSEALLLAQRQCRRPICDHVQCARGPGARGRQAIQHCPKAHCAQHIHYGGVAGHARRPVLVVV